MSIVRDEAKKVLDILSDEASWDDVMYEMYVRKKINEGIQAADSGALISHRESGSKCTYGGCCALTLKSRR